MGSDAPRFLAMSAAQAAEDFPSWNDILNAQNNEHDKQLEITKLEGVISQLKSNLATAQQERARVQGEYDAIAQRLQAAQDKYDELNLQAQEQRQRADEAKRRAGAMVAQLARSGSTDVSVDLYLSGNKADDLLYGLSAMSRVTTVSNSIYDEAKREARLADSLAQQARAVAKEISGLLDAAEQKLKERQAAEANYASALETQQANEQELNDQLAALKTTTTKLTKERAAGLEKQRLERIRKAKIAAEKRRKAREAAKRRAAAQAAREAKAQREEAAREQAASKGSKPRKSASKASGSGDAGSGSVGDSGGSSKDDSADSQYGVVYPTINYRVTSPYGWRIHPIYGYRIFHQGVDFAASAGTPVYSVADGTVIKLAYDRYRGYYIDIRHRVNGTTVTTRYQHLLTGSRRVHVGQRVSSGQRIASVGSTGDSTGPHLHFEVHLASTANSSSTTVNPLTWLRKYA